MARSQPPAPPRDLLGPVQGEVSWFCCGTAWGPCSTTGRGACGTCNSGSMQHAWPNTSDNCLAITHPDTCGVGLSRRTCGFNHRTTALCSGASVVTSIADCGPQTDLFCGERSCCGATCASNRLIDLTPAAFSQIASLSAGLRPAEISTP
ncbi:septal ring lytic transglycosylase RlpA family protein [Sphaerisporangium corydalis]|uniref:Septal ring lytic transglycosylase RlpA family protein n=1 Tax=Sphaerisporangium corydalis TaxID=1441875 RepID=A0ABV9EJE8_9ACTN|nr:septal ring lytic transglycosylase RlpA family protein [Sphaerisporangium corydalis]